MTYKEFSFIIKEKRLEKGLRQKDIADMIFVSLSFYNKIENGKQEPSFEVLCDLINIFEIDILKLIKNKKPKQFLYFD